MTDDEVKWVKQKISESAAIPFITRESDIEGYFLLPEHLSELIGVPAQEITDWLDELALKDHNPLSLSFTRKRDEVKWSLYKNRNADPPSTAELLGTDVPLPINKRLGKSMLKLVRGNMNIKFGVTVDPIQHSEHLACPELKAIFTNVAT